MLEERSLDASQDSGNFSANRRGRRGQKVFWNRMTMNQIRSIEDHVDEVRRIANAPIKVEKLDQFVRYHYDPDHTNSDKQEIGRTTYSSSWDNFECRNPQTTVVPRYAMGPPPSSVKHLMVDPGASRIPCVSRYGSEFTPITPVGDPLEKRYHRRSNPITKFGEALSLQASTMR